ncbi:SET domain-containing protein-lysine N-methyltransferase [Candidatus Kaiserbacteria bacterium]|nr:SET domain-containing protein-lysine N-methyltransferase [Candidatus Kaiserbacteria bacterium]
MLPNTDIEVRKSRIQGRGVFALRDFTPGETVLVWDTSYILTDDEYARLPEDQRHFVVRFKGEWLYMQEPARYVNHSCEANTVARDGTDVAVAPIHAGDEITSDYRSEMPSGERMKCLCGTKSCTGYIEGAAV